MYAQGMGDKFVKKTLCVSMHTVRDISRYLRERFESETIAGSVGGAFRTGLWTPGRWEFPPSVAPRRLEALDWASRGMTDTLIAEKMGVSEITVDNHMKLALRALNAKKRAHGVWKAFHWGILLP
jgi:DNA-binding NarL/FixJ family response regulator